MKRIMQPLILMLAMLLLTASLQAQTAGQMVTRKFVNKRSEPLVLYVANDAHDGRQTIKNTIEIEGGVGAFRKIDLEVGDYVWAEMKDDKFLKTDRIFINGTRTESQEIPLFPQRSFLEFLGKLGNNSQSTRFLGNAYNYYGVDITQYSPRRVIDGFRPNQIFKGLGGESTQSDTRSYYLQNGTGTLMPVGYTYTGADSDQNGATTVSEYHSMKSFKEAWNVSVGLAGKHPKGVGASVDFSYGEEFEKSANQSNVFYLKQQFAREYGVSVDIHKAEFDYDFIRDVALIKTQQDADNFINKYGTHYPATVIYGGQFSQYTSISKNDFYEAKRKNLNIKLAVEASKTKPTTETTSNPDLLDPDKSVKTIAPGSSKSGNGSVGFSKNTSEELQRIMSNSTSRYTAIGGTITSGGDWSKEGTRTAIGVDLRKISDLIDARILKSRYTESDLNGIREMVEKAVNDKIAELNNYADEKPVRAYKMQISQIRVTNHIDDLQRDGKGFIKAKVIGAQKDRPIEADLFAVADYGHPDFNKNGEIHFSDDREENPTTRTWHYFAQEANDDGTFPPLTVDFQAEIWDRDHCCGDELAAVGWGEKMTNPLVPNQAYEHVMKFKDQDILPLQDWEIEATIIILPVDPFENSSPAVSNTRSAIASPAAVKKNATPFTPPTMTEEEFKALATARTAPAKEVKFYQKNGISIADARAIASQNGWEIASSDEVSAAFQQHDLDVYAFGMMADGRFAVPVQRDHSNFKKGANIGAVGGNQGFFYTTAEPDREKPNPPATTGSPVATSNAIAPLNNGFVRIQNSWYKDNYIHNENGKIEQSQIQANWWSAQWKIVPVHSGWVRIQNRWHPDQYLHNQSGKLEVGPIQNNWASAMWKLIPVHSGWVRIQNSWYKDHYIHNQNGQIELGPIQNNWASAMWKVE